MTWETRYDQAMMNVFNTPKMVVERGQGVKVWDVTGKEYLDLLSGIAVNALGHNHPALVKAITEQSQKALHVSNFFATTPQIELAEKLQECLATEGYVGASARVFLSNSGAEAIEAALKVSLANKPNGRIVALKQGFHGRTLGALSVTYKPAYKEPFGMDSFLNTTFIDPTPAALSAAMDDDVCAVIAEPIQGEAGVFPVSPEFFIRARDLCDRYDAFLIADEVQTGIGRTGRWMCHSDKVKADIVTFAKGLGGGVPIGATVGVGKAGQVLHQGMHGATFGGNPLAAAASLAVLNEVSGLLEQVRQTGAQLAADLRALGYEVRGSGLLLGIAVADAPAQVAQLQERGFIVNAANSTTLRLAPPLIITTEELRPFVAAMQELKDNS
ncbi:MAG: acetylornithine transaminase [Trueperella sp.]|nr:acetylornithine transaminase [Trueperella sp.]